MLSFRRCLAASFFLHAARRQLDGTYRYEGLYLITRMFCQYFFVVLTFSLKDECALALEAAHRKFTLESSRICQNIDFHYSNYRT